VVEFWVTNRRKKKKEKKIEREGVWGCTHQKIIMAAATLALAAKEITTEEGVEEDDGKRGGEEKMGEASREFPSPKGPLETTTEKLEEKKIEEEEQKKKKRLVVEDVERDERFEAMCKETSIKVLQKAHEKLTKRETQAHNKEWILMKMAGFVVEGEDLSSSSSSSSEDEEEGGEGEAIKGAVFARLRRIVEETGASERGKESKEAGDASRFCAPVPTPSTSNNTKYHNNKKGNKRKRNALLTDGDVTAITGTAPLQCTRNDGKSWRCSALAVEGHKHCAKHLRWGYGARSAKNAALIANIAAAEKNKESIRQKQQKKQHAFEKKTRHVPNRRVILSDAGEKQQQLREEKMYEQQRVEYEIRMRKKIKSSLVQTPSSEGAEIVCTIELCSKNDHDEEDDALSDTTSVPLFLPPGGGSVKNSSSSLSSLTSTNAAVMKTINLDDFSGYGPFREHLLNLAAATSNSTERKEEIAVVYWTAHNTAHQIALGEPYEYFKAKCVRLHAKVYPNASVKGSGDRGGFRSIKIPLVAGPASSSSSSSPSATTYMMLMMQNTEMYPRHHM
jgi:hypothetical protein